MALKRARYAEVWNDDNKEYVEKWDDRTIKIPAKGKVMMGYREAINFRGRYPGKRDGEMVAKMIRVVPVEKEQEVVQVNTCNFCGASFKNMEELESHLVLHKDQHVEVPDGAEAVKEQVFVCPFCAIIGEVREFKTLPALKRHMTTTHKDIDSDKLMAMIGATNDSNADQGIS